MIQFPATGLSAQIIQKIPQLEEQMGNFSSVSRHPQQRGQGMTEYIIIVALIAIAAIGVYSFFGQAVRQPTAQELPGKTAAKQTQGAQSAADQASQKAKDANSPSRAGPPAARETRRGNDGGKARRPW